MSQHNGNPATRELRAHILEVLRMVNVWPREVIAAELGEVLEECDRIPIAVPVRLGEMTGELHEPTPPKMLVPGVNGGTVHTVTGVPHFALRVRLLSDRSRYTERGAETVVLYDETFYYPIGQRFDVAEQHTLNRASALGYEHVDRCVSGAGTSLTFIVPTRLWPAES